MRYLVLADVHANLEALEAVLSDAAGAYDSMVFLGDAVGYGPNPNECVERLSRLADTVMLAGNHDLAAVGEADVQMFNDMARAAIVWTRASMTPEITRLLLSLRPRIDRPEFALAHASPRDPIWEYMLDAYQAPPNFEAFSQPLCLIGHTHVPADFAQPNSPTGGVGLYSPAPGETTPLGDGARHIINPGGVGQPRDGDPRAAYGILDAGAGTFAFRRVAYPVELTQQKILAAGLPELLAHRLALGR